jgi:glycosyltransferase involved in cell wall biosynthesis
VKIAVRATPLLNPLSGVGQYVLQLYTQMLLLRQECRFFYGHHWSNRLLVGQTDRAREFYESASRYWVSSRAVALMRRVIFRIMSARSSVDIYHEPNFLPYSSHSPLVLTIHDLSPLRFPETHRPDWVKAFERRLPTAVARARAILVDSEFVRSEVLEYFPESLGKVTTTLLGVRNGFSPLSDLQCRSVIASWGLEHGSYILMVGTLEPRKNLVTGLRAYAGLPIGLRSRFPLVVAGMNGWLNKSFESEMVSLVNKGQLRLLGFVPDDLLNALYSGARTLLYPSLYEGFGLPPLEAMACGTPVITSNRASLPEVVGDAGIQVDALNVDGLRMALQELLEDNELCVRLGRLGVQRAATFTWRRTAVETLDVFNRVLAS